MTAPLIRPYRPGDETGILDLYRVVFKLDMTLDEWRWYYAGAARQSFPMGDGGRTAAAVIVVAEAPDGRVIGHYAVQPRPFCVDGKRCLAGLVMGSMVAPEHRNITTFIDMAKMAYSLCREGGIEFLYAFPNDNVWLVRQRMLDWQALSPIAALVAPLGEVRAEPRQVERASGAESVVERLPVGGPFPAADWLEGCPAAGIRAVHSAEWLTWRLLERPQVEYSVYTHRVGGELLGYVALKRYVAADGRVDGHIVGWRVRPGEEASTGAVLLAEAKWHFQQAGVDRVSMWLMPASPLHDLAVRAGFLPEEKQRKNFGYLALDDGLNTTLAAGAKWDVTMSDSDVF